MSFYHVWPDIKAEPKVIPQDNERRIEIAKAAVVNALTDNYGWCKGPYELHIVGSTYIRDRTDGDVDILTYHESFDVDAMSFSGWLYGGSAGLCPDNNKWMSWKKIVNGVEVNMLIVGDKAYRNQWLTAAEVCRFLHLKGVALPSPVVHGVHEIIMDDSTAEDEVKRRDY